MAYTRCRLCLEDVKENFVLLENFERNMLETLTPLIRLDISDDPTICDNCTKSLQVSYDLKALWLEDNERIKKLLFLRDAYPEPYHEMCCLCGQAILQKMEDEDSNWREMLQQSIPELFIHSADKSSACKPCVDDVKKVCAFLNKCLQTEGKITDYCSHKHMEHVNLDDVFKYYNPLVSVEKKERKTEDNVNETEPILESKGNNKTETNKPENNCDNNEGTYTEQQSISDATDGPSAKKQKKKSGGAKQFACDKCSYVGKSRSALVSHWISHKDPSETTMYRCTVCGHETKRKADLRAHMMIHKNPNDLRTFDCALCSYRSIRKCDLKQHVRMHQPKSHKCPHCTYVTNNEVYLNKYHLLIHKDVSEVPIFSCKECLYQTCFKRDLRKHEKSHQKEDEGIPTYRCNWCDFVSRSKQALKDHMLVHKCPSEIQFFECYNCGYKTKYKRDLKFHIENHYKFMLETLYCANCPFQTKRKEYLRHHMEIHNSHLWYRCEKCEFKSKRKGNLMSHMATHNKPKPSLKRPPQHNVPLLMIPFVMQLKRESDIVDLSIGDVTEEKLLL